MVVRARNAAADTDTADEALTAGLVNRIVPAERIAAVVREVAETSAGNAPLTIRASKEMIRRIHAHRRITAEAGRDLNRYVLTPAPTLRRGSTRFSPSARRSGAARRILPC